MDIYSECILAHDRQEEKVFPYLRHVPAIIPYGGLHKKQQQRAPTENRVACNGSSNWFQSCALSNDCLEYCVQSSFQIILSRVK